LFSDSSLYSPLGEFQLRINSKRGNTAFFFSFSCNFPNFVIPYFSAFSLCGFFLISLNIFITLVGAEAGSC
jgi:hypothetical protein